jgi:hypothetical protein
MGRLKRVLGRIGVIGEGEVQMGLPLCVDLENLKTGLIKDGVCTFGLSYVNTALRVIIKNPPK